MTEWYSSENKRYDICEILYCVLLSVMHQYLISLVDKSCAETRLNEGQSDLVVLWLEPE